MKLLDRRIMIVLNVFVLIFLVTAALSWFIVRQQTAARIDRLSKGVLGIVYALARSLFVLSRRFVLHWLAVTDVTRFIDLRLAGYPKQFIDIILVYNLSSTMLDMQEAKR
jgi:hypothetical protein